MLLSANGQSQKLDSLRERINQSSGTIRVDLLNEYAYSISSYDYLKANKVIKESNELSAKLNYKKGVAEALLYRGIIESNIGLDSISMVSFRTSLAYSHEAKAKHLRGRTLTALGLAYQNFDLLDSAQIYYQQAYEVLKDSLKPLYLSFLYLNLAELHRIKGNQDLQFTYLKRSFEIRKRMNEKHAFAWISVSLSAYYTDRGDFKTAGAYLDIAQKNLENDTTESEEIAIINKQRGMIDANLGKHTLALDLFAKTKKYYERNPYRYDFVNLLTEIGIVQRTVANYEISLKYFFEGLKQAEANHYDRTVAEINYHIARVYYFLDQGDLAESFCKRNLQYVISHRLELDEAATRNLMGLVAMRKHNYDSALQYFARALLLREKNNYRLGISGTLGGLGALYFEMKNYRKAEEYGLKSLAIAEEINFALGKNYSYESLGELYVQIKDFQKAENYLNKGIALSKTINSWDVLVDNYKHKRDLWLAREDYRQAATYSLLYEKLKDSIFNKNVTNRILTLQHDFDLSQRDNQIKILQQQQQLQENALQLQHVAIRQQRIIIVVAFVILILGGAYTYLVYGYYIKVKRLNRSIYDQNEEITAQSERLKQANKVLGSLNRDISEKNEEIQAQSEELAESNQTIVKINEGLEMKIKERTSELKEAYHELDTFFYRSSHDFRRPLTTFMGLAEVGKIMVKEKPVLELFEKVNDTARNLDKMLSKLQSVSTAGMEDLKYNEISFKNILQTEIRSFDKEIFRRKIQIKTQINITKPFYSYPSLLSFVVQNLLENSISFCSEEKPEISISVEEVANNVVLTVNDNGIGIDPVYLPRVFEMYFRASERSTGNGLGLYIIKKMTDRMHGHVEIDSKLGAGTSVKIFLPFSFS